MEFIQQKRLKKYDSNYNNCFVGDLVPEPKYYEGVKFVNKTHTTKEKILKRTDLINSTKDSDFNKTFYNFKN